MMKKHISGITAAAVLVSAAGGVAFAQTGSVTVHSAAMRCGDQSIYLLDLNPAVARALTSWAGAVQPEAKPAASASQAATAAPSGTAPSSQPPASTPAAAAPAKLTYIDIVIKGIAVGEGRKPSVRYRYKDDEPWKLARIGDKLKEGVRFQIGYFSALTLLIGDGQELTFSAAGNFVINEAYNDGKTEYTRINMEEGKFTFDVKKVRYANDVQIKTPDMTLSITGTTGYLWYTPGQATIAAGAEDNRGRIDVENRRSAQRAVMTRAERVDSSSFNAAFNAARASVVETATDLSRERDETRLVKRTEGSTQAVPLDIGETSTATLRMDLLPPTPGPGPTPPNGGIPGTNSILHIDSHSGLLFETTPQLETSILREGMIFDHSATDGGSAILTESTGFRRLVYVESAEVGGVVRNHFRSLAVDSPITAAEAVGEISSTGVSAAPLVRGLGAIGSELYAAGRLGSRDNIYQVDLTNLSLKEVMSPGLQLEGALGGVSERGTLLGFAVDPGGAVGSSLLDRGAIIEMDPRNNYMISAFSAVNSTLGNGGSVSNPNGLNLSQVQAITGLAGDANTITLSAAMGPDMGQIALLRYETINGAPRLAEVRVAPDGFTSGLASETTTPPPAAMVLREPTGPIDMVGINARFAMMAYSQQALNSGVVERALRTEILKTANNPDGCVQSGALNALSGMLSRHIDQRAGIGQTVHEFRVNLSDFHPCRPAGQLQ